MWCLGSLVSATFTSGSPVAEKWNGDEGMRGDGGDETPQRMKATQRSRRPNTENRKVSRSRSQSSPTIPFISRILVSALTSKLNAAGTETGSRGFAPGSCCARQVEKDKGRSVARASAREFGAGAASLRRGKRHLWLRGSVRRAKPGSSPVAQGFSNCRYGERLVAVGWACFRWEGIWGWREMEVMRQLNE